MRLYSKAIEKLDDQRMARAAQYNALAIAATKGDKEALRKLNEASR